MGQRVALLTGASSGIGRACARRLHGTGWVVVGASRHPVARDPWHTLSMDVDDDTSVHDGVARVVTDHGRLDAVVTAAGWGLSGPVETTSLADARRQLETNFWGSVRVVQEALPVMRGAGEGHIALISSLGGLVGLPFQAYYSASKFALEGWAEALAYEVAPFGIRVTLVEPGNASTGFTGNRVRRDPVADDAAYVRENRAAVGAMERDERNGIAPEKVAAAVERVLLADDPPRRVSVGTLDERLGAFGKRLMPYRVFEWLARRTLGL